MEPRKTAVDFVVQVVVNSIVLAIQAWFLMLASALLHTEFDASIPAVDWWTSYVVVLIIHSISWAPKYEN